MAYLSKRLDPVASGWPSCLRMVAAVAALVKDADKLTLGQNWTITAPHALESVVWQPPDRWLTINQMTHYQSLLQNSECIQFAPATLLPDPKHRVIILHDCNEILAEFHGTRKDLSDQPLAQPDVTWYTDGSSYMAEGKRYAGAAVVDGCNTIWAEPLPWGCFSPRGRVNCIDKGP